MIRFINYEFDVNIFRVLVSPMRRCCFILYFSRCSVRVRWLVDEWASTSLPNRWQTLPFPAPQCRSFRIILCVFFFSSEFRWATHSFIPFVYNILLSHFVWFPSNIVGNSVSVQNEGLSGINVRSCDWNVRHCAWIFTHLVSHRANLFDDKQQEQKKNSNRKINEKKSHSNWTQFNGALFSLSILLFLFCSTSAWLILSCCARPCSSFIPANLKLSLIYRLLSSTASTMLLFSVDVQFRLPAKEEKKKWKWIFRKSDEKQCAPNGWQQAMKMVSNSVLHSYFSLEIFRSGFWIGFTSSTSPSLALHFDALVLVLQSQCTWTTVTICGRLSLTASIHRCQTGLKLKIRITNSVIKYSSSLRMSLPILKCHFGYFAA